MMKSYTRCSATLVSMNFLFYGVGDLREGKVGGTVISKKWDNLTIYEASVCTHGRTYIHLYMDTDG
jgi:hypothetical protein